jgi:hypothetical protein
VPHDRAVGDAGPELVRREVDPQRPSDARPEHTDVHDPPRPQSLDVPGQAGERHRPDVQHEARVRAAGDDRDAVSIGEVDDVRGRRRILTPDVGEVLGRADHRRTRLGDDRKHRVDIAQVGGGRDDRHVWPCATQRSGQVGRADQGRGGTGHAIRRGLAIARRRAHHDPDDLQPRSCQRQLEDRLVRAPEADEDDPDGRRAAGHAEAGSISCVGRECRSRRVTDRASASTSG